MKLGKGCKFIVTGNTVSINYPQHKTVSFDKPSQFKKEKEAILNIFGYEKTGFSTVSSGRYENKGCIQICVL